MSVFLDDLTSLRLHSISLLRQGIRSSTARTYTSAQKRYLAFCDTFLLTALPATEELLLLYIAHLDRALLKGSSIRVYLAAVRSLHIEEGFKYDLSDSQRVKRTLRALTISAPPPKQKRPITSDILARMQGCIPPGYNGGVLWAAMTLAFFGCLRAGELCVQSAFDPKINLCLADVTYYTHMDSDYLCVRIKRSKTDSLNKGFQAVIGCTMSPVCSHCSMRRMLTVRAASHLPRDNDSPLFFLSSASPVTKAYLVTATRSILKELGLDAAQFGGHSYRAGAATSAALAGHVIMRFSY